MARMSLKDQGAAKPKMRSEVRVGWRRAARWRRAVSGVDMKYSGRKGLDFFFFCGVLGCGIKRQALARDGDENHTRSDDFAHVVEVFTRPGVFCPFDCGGGALL